MPIFHLRCLQCGVKGRKLLRADEVAYWLEHNSCQACQGTLVRDAQGPAATVIERIDTGIQGRAIERPVRAKELIHERNLAHQRRLNPEPPVGARKID